MTPQQPQLAPMAPAINPTIPRRLSPTALARYQTCPRQFFLADVARVERPRERSPRLAQANAVHHALERFFGVRPEDREPRAEVLHRALRSVWRRHAPAALFSDPGEEAQYGTAALRMLSSFAERFDTTGVPLAREQWVNLRLESGTRLYGKVDRIDRAGDGSLEVIDYKTGARPLANEELPDEPAAQVYLLATEEATGHTVSRVRFIYLGAPDGAVDVRWDVEREDANLTRSRVGDLIDEIHLDRDFQPQPGDQCGWCPFALLHCPDAKRVELAELDVPDDIAF